MPHRPPQPGCAPNSRQSRRTNVVGIGSPIPGSPDGGAGKVADFRGTGSDVPSTEGEGDGDGDGAAVGATSTDPLAGAVGTAAGTRRGPPVPPSSWPPNAAAPAPTTAISMAAAPMPTATRT